MEEEGEESNEGSGDGTEAYEGEDTEVSLAYDSRSTPVNPSVKSCPQNVHQATSTHTFIWGFRCTIQHIQSFFHRLILPSLLLYRCVITVPVHVVFTLVLHKFSGVSQCL